LAPAANGGLLFLARGNYDALKDAPQEKLDKDPPRL
jgi:hypothetical protein